ncbi:glycosyltransferase [uncultured Paludibaculum sp.]|uniref:glycosyltransferase n=1 Tax=uncultured Paludibaculum sp. TaxID=1765020 RepID=UPI002AABB30B|nr:glycosyltransferase [uncultured Paludibaculum sp.]
MPLQGRRLAAGVALTRRLSGLKEIVRPYYLKWLYFRLKEANCPRPFVDCWKYPSVRVESSTERLKLSDPEHQDVVFLPMADWHACIQRSQHLASTFASMGHRCFFLNPNLGREFPQTYFGSERVLVSTIEPRVHELHVHLLREPVFHHRLLRPEENRRIVQAVEDLLRAAGSSRPTLVVSFPLWTEVAVELRERMGCRIVYDCHDLLQGFGNISNDLIEAEGHLLASSDLVVFSAQWLMEQTMAQHPLTSARTALVRNAVNHRDFAAAVARAPRARDGAAKTVGYVGALSSWFDTEAMRRAALTHPEWRFVLIGFVGSEKLDELRDIPNVQFHGEVPHSELPSHLARMDVAVIPFLKSPLTMATNPIKLYEYFACGLPVVSTRLPEVEGFPDLAYCFDTPEEFVLQLERAMREDDALLRARRIGVAQRESWVARCAQLNAAIHELDATPVDDSFLAPRAELLKGD